MKKLLVFVVIAAGSLLASWYSFGDSAHAMGMISATGGRALHPVHLPSGLQRYTIVVTATVLPPYSGDARVAVEGTPELDVSLHGSNPVIDLGFRHRPLFEQRTFVGLRPRDRLTMWAVLRTPALDPVCGHRAPDGAEPGGRGSGCVWFCSAACREAFERDPGNFSRDRFPTGRYEITFTDAETGAGVLKIPVIFGAGDAEGGGHVH